MGVNVIVQLGDGNGFEDALKIYMCWYITDIVIDLYEIIIKH